MKSIQFQDKDFNLVISFNNENHSTIRSPILNKNKIYIKDRKQFKHAKTKNVHKMWTLADKKLLIDMTARKEPISAMKESLGRSSSAIHQAQYLLKTTDWATKMIDGRTK